METQQSGYTPRCGPEVKNKRSSAKDGALDNPGGEPDPTKGVRRRCKRPRPPPLVGHTIRFHNNSKYFAQKSADVQIMKNPDYLKILRTGQIPPHYGCLLWTAP